MSVELCSVRPLFGGAISTVFPQRFQDVSDIRQVPDHQEVFVDPSRDESLIFELLDFKTDVGDNGSAYWFLNNLAREQDAEGFQLIEQSEVVEAPGLSYKNIPAVATTAIGEMGVKAVIAKSFERIHRSNLVGMGIIPLCFKSLTGHERYTINLPTDISEIRPGQDVTVTTDNGKSFTCTVRFDTEVELAYFNHGGILPYVIRNLSKQ